MILDGDGCDRSHGGEGQTSTRLGAFLEMLGDLTMNKTYYVCKYTPVELLEALGGECEILNDMPEGFDLAEQVAHPNICGFGKAVLEAVLAGK